MRMRPNDRLVAMVEAALGERPVSDLGPLSRTENVRMAQLSRLAALVQADHYRAPGSLVARCKSIFGGPAIVSVPMTSSTLSLAGTRSAPGETTHALFERGDLRVRVMYVRESAGWRVIGEASSNGWTVITDERIVETDAGGRFEILVSGQHVPTLLLVRGDERFAIAPPESIE